MEGGVDEKSIHRGDYLKRVLRQFADLRWGGGLARKRRVGVFEGEIHTSMHTIKMTVAKKVKEV